MDIPVIEMIERSGWIARVILLLLAFFSVATWAIIFSRLKHFSQVRKLNRSFREKFDSSGGLTDLEKMDKRMEQCPMGIMGKTSLAEYRRILSDARADTGVRDWSFYLQNQFQMAAERIESVSSSAGSHLSRGLVLLAIISSIAPFMGLLGTVWGIMNSFYEIGNQGSASLPVVAPGIAEALITTIVGLGVAIPALFFYNIFTHGAGRIEDELDEFSGHLLLRLKREIFGLLFRDKQTATTAKPRDTRPAT
jgi:biopolymer transport protein TolQ